MVHCKDSKKEGVDNCQYSDSFIWNKLCPTGSCWQWSTSKYCGEYYKNKLCLNYSLLAMIKMDSFPLGIQSTAMGIASGVSQIDRFVTPFIINK